MGRNILIVDDEEQIRRVVRIMLERRGYSVCEAAEGDEAIRALKTVPFDLVITDILMPQRNGLETILFIRKELPDVPIIAISAPSNSLYLESACGLGASKVFPKPFALKDLADAVDELVASRPPADGSS